MRIGQGLRRRVLYNVQRFQSDPSAGLFAGDENNFPLLSAPLLAATKAQIPDGLRPRPIAVAVDALKGLLQNLHGL